MSIESANRFLNAAATDEELREKFGWVQSPADFLSVSQRLGYSFTTDELMALAKQQSEGIHLRRSTGVWKWLRHTHWL
jgi:predicted ribosomally synthesized peptide with nif11-like leader